MSTEVPQPPRNRSVGLDKPWVVIVIISWLLVTAALAATAVTGRNIGKPTWWMDDLGEWRLVWLVPFVAPIVVIVTAVKSGRWAPFAGMGASLYLGAIAILDLENSPAVALIQVVIACAALLVSLASLAGRNR